MRRLAKIILFLVILMGLGSFIGLVLKVLPYHPGISTTIFLLAGTVFLAIACAIDYKRGDGPREFDSAIAFFSLLVTYFLIVIFGRIWYIFLK